MKEEIKIHPNASIREAMEALDRTADKVLLVVDEDERLLGCLSDGDLRRYILRGHDLEGDVEEVYNRHPVTVFEGDCGLPKVRKLLLDHRIELIPVLDSDMKVLRYITWDEAFGDEEKPSRVGKPLSLPVVIMAGGKGTRLDPLTRVLPKPLIPVGDRPIIELIIDRFREYGIKEYFLTINHMSRLIEAYFSERTSDIRVTFIREDRPLGTAGSLRYLIDRLHGAFFMTNCDVLIDTNYAELHAFHEKNAYDMTLVASLKHHPIHYGICEIGEDGSLLNIREKPDYSFLANTGLYIINSELLEIIPDNKVYPVTDLIQDVQKRGGRVGVFPVSENSWIDIGQFDEFKRAVDILNR